MTLSCTHLPLREGEWVVGSLVAFPVGMSQHELSMTTAAWRLSPTPDAFPTLQRKLTPRELEVLGLTAKGMTSKEIAVHLGISPRTADVHRTHLIRKLGFRNRVEAVRYALSAGILTVQPSEVKIL